ncbi:AAA domain protein [Paraburkholderia xenovorans LB400]|uniref:Phage resistance protein n=1 Tax=Paraburkholderia xenovorans (strain LB400) TaxID=266265 RepID=Q13JU1_PARXL|nr:ATP-binding protein [Paraburkholderia xenovorans]ABE35648.1 putative phage resistance protein [Paraburkholderia xenovorans LB400]AIP37283.1 AAA domain protein [Paraburkholderia xenovorans LB400]
MLVEFRVKNFRSIRDDLCLSMVASKDKEKATTNTVETGISAIPTLLRSAVVYGPNASGKSALVSAMQFAQAVVATSATLKPDQPLNYAPFKLDPITVTQPSEFEFTFIQDKVRYQYGFALLPDRIAEEWLYVYKAPKPQTWFERKGLAESVHTYTFGSSLVGQRKVWQVATRSNALFLSTAVQLNSDSLRPIYDWITSHLSIFAAGTQPMFDFSTNRAATDDGKKMLVEFLNAADIGISDLSTRVQKQHVFNVEISENGPLHTVSEREVRVPLFMHRSAKASAIFQMEEESTGTQRLFAFAAPIIDALKVGRAVVVDELDGSLHSHITRFLVQLFHLPTRDGSAAQLIFTTHDTSLLDANIFRRDQIWFMEKGQDQVSTIVPLSEFSPRKNEALERGYLSGRYGALPMIEDIEDFDDLVQKD